MAVLSALEGMLVVGNQTPCIQHPAVTFPVDISSEILGDYTQAVFGAAYVEAVLTEPGSRNDVVAPADRLGHHRAL
jgi:hypothetical protein